MEFTVFWSHPNYGSGSFVTTSTSATDAGIEAGNSLPGDLVDDDGEEDELEMSIIRDDLDIKIWAGSHLTSPPSTPDYIYQ